MVAADSSRLIPAVASPAGPVRSPLAETLAPIEEWFARQGWRPLDFQRQCWEAYLTGRSGLLQVPTGSGKTYAAVMGPIAELLEEARTAGAEPAGLRLVVITPLRALSRECNQLVAARPGSRPEERLAAVALVAPFTIDNGLLTQTLKPRRDRISARDAAVIAGFYGEG